MNLYTLLSSTQTTSAFTYFSYDTGVKTFSITPFTASKIVTTNPTPVYTYTVQSYNANAGMLTVDPVTGVISISDIVSVGPAVVNLVILGSLTDCQTITATFTITKVVNSPPTFSGPPSTNIPAT